MTKLKDILSEIKWEGKDIELGKIYTAKTMPPFKVTENLKEEDGYTDATMAQQQLSRSADYAKMLIDKLKSKGDLEPWVQAKITKAEDYLNSVYGYMKGKEDTE